MIKVLLFANLQEKVGKNSIEIADASITVKDLKDKIRTAYNLDSLDHVMVAVNEEYALEQDTVKTGDVVAFIPPVSGG